jgi:hypothetical protein
LHHPGVVVAVDSAAANNMLYMDFNLPFICKNWFGPAALARGHASLRVKKAGFRINENWTKCVS